MHEVGSPLDLSVFTRLIPTLFFLAVGVFYFLKNTAAKFFDIGGAAAGGFDRELVAVGAEDCTTKCSRCNSVRYWYVPSAPLWFNCTIGSACVV